MSELLVYKASAGSGKTFTLAVEYIKLLILNPRAYRQILAVTFTNKATAEMKERILSQAVRYSDRRQRIRSLSQPYQRRNGKNRAGNTGSSKHCPWLYVTRLQSVSGRNNRFFFFQSVMRNLARELELSP